MKNLQKKYEAPAADVVLFGGNEIPCTFSGVEVVNPDGSSNPDAPSMSSGSGDLGPGVEF